jgi:hypothetical protein
MTTCKKKNAFFLRTGWYDFYVNQLKREPSGRFSVVRAAIKSQEQTQQRTGPRPNFHSFSSTLPTRRIATMKGLFTCFALAFFGSLVGAFAPTQKAVRVRKSL